MKDNLKNNLRNTLTLVAAMMIIAGMLLIAHAAQYPGNGQGGTTTGALGSPAANFSYTPTNLSASNVTDANGTFEFNFQAAHTYSNYTGGLGGILGYTNEPRFLIRPGYGISLAVYITNAPADDAGAAVFVLNLNRSVDGVFGDPTTNFTYTFNLSATGTNYFTTNIPWSTNLDGYQSVGILSSTNGTTNGIGVAVEFARPIPWNPSPRGY